MSCFGGVALPLFKGHTGVVRCVDVSPDGGRVVTCSDDRTARINDAVSGKNIAVLEGHGGAVESCMFGPDGRGRSAACHYSRDGSRVVTGSWDCSVKLWCASTGKIEHTLEGHTKSVTCCVISRAARSSSPPDRTARLGHVPYAVLHRKSLRAAKKADIKRVAAQEAAAEVPSANLARTDPEDRALAPGPDLAPQVREDDSLHTAKLWYDPEDPNAKK
ncbi:hypothetical protein SO694_00051289 [Aureococcus anophagefferens]|uniref:Uncharacterized protein n=1 Tax=Aureococcus anophagefferens TaxID=44056 RepID=A0ABR1FYC3_AURAN